MDVYTAGYQRENIERFVEKVKSAEVDVIVDVRTRPWSRKAGFSKTKLSQHLANAGITYQHVESLGMPAHLLEERSGDNAAILTAYREQLPSHQEVVDHLADLARKQSVCLLCFEENEHHCHRSVLASYLAAQYPALTIVHLPPAAR